MGNVPFLSAHSAKNRGDRPADFICTYCATKAGKLD